MLLLWQIKRILDIANPLHHKVLKFLCKINFTIENADSKLYNKNRILWGGEEDYGKYLYACRCVGTEIRRD